MDRLRPYRHSDIGELARLLGEAGGWATHNAPSPEELRARWARRQVDPDAVIKVLPDLAGRLIAYYYATPFGDGSSRMAFEVAVHPDWRRRGIASHLYTLALEEAHRKGISHMTSPVYVLMGDRNQEGVEFLLRRGFSCQSAYWQMRVDRLAERPQPRWPAGFEMRPFLSVTDAYERWAELIIATFNEPGGAAMIEAQLTEPGSSPEGYFFAADARSGKLIGTSRARLDPSPNAPNGVIGYLGTVGVLPEYRRKGVAQALILQTLNYLHSQGAHSAVLFVEDGNTGAQELYLKMGWHKVYRSDNYWKSLQSMPDMS